VSEDREYDSLEKTLFRLLHLGGERGLEQHDLLLLLGLVNLMGIVNLIGARGESAAAAVFSGKTGAPDGEAEPTGAPGGPPGTGGRRGPAFPGVEAADAGSGRKK